MTLLKAFIHLVAKLVDTEWESMEMFTPEKLWNWICFIFFLDTSQEGSIDPGARQVLKLTQVL